LKYLEGKYFRRVASQELNLPKITRQHISCKALATERGKELLKEFEEQSSGHISTMKKEAAIAKVDYTLKYALDLFDQEVSPILIFTDHIEPAQKIHEGLKKHRRKGDYITGARKPEDRAKLVSEFQDGRLEYLVCTIGSMSTGFTLTATNRIIFNDLSWCPSDNAQAEARIYRISQNRPCFITYIVSEGIDEKIISILEEKMGVLKDAL